MLCCEMWGLRNDRGLCSFLSSWLHPGTASSSQGTRLLALGTCGQCFSSQSSNYGKGLGKTPFSIILINVIIIKKFTFLASSKQRYFFPVTKKAQKTKD